MLLQRNLLLFFFLMTVSGFVYCSSHDGAKENNFKIQCEKIDKLNNSALLAYNQKRYVEAEKQALLANEKAISIDYKEGCENACLTLAECYYDLRKPDKSIEFFKKVMVYKKIKGDFVGVSYCFNNLGLLYKRKNNFEKALEYYFKSLKLGEKINNLERVASASNNIGNIYETFENFSKAIKYYTISLNSEKSIGNSIGIAKTLGNIGVIYRKQGAYNKSLNNYHQALIIYNKVNEPYETATILNNISNVYLNLNQLDKALDYSEKALKIAEKEEYSELVCYILSSLGDIYLKNGRLEKSLHFQFRAYDLTTEQELLRHILKKITVIYGDLNDDKNLIKFYKKFMAIEHDINDAKIDKQIQQIQNVYLNEKKEKELELSKKNKKIEKLITYLKISGYMALFLFLYVFYVKYKEREKLTKKLETLARTDQLTGLPNRRDIVERIEYELIRYGRTNKTFSLLMCDIDFFKKINDLYGHEAGDLVLKELALIVQKELRKSDTMSRWGGEEFLILLPETTSQGGVLIGDKIRQLIEDHCFIYNENEIKLSLTIGVCEFEKSMDINSIINNADSALYKGKQQGRNRVISN